MHGHHHMSVNTVPATSLVQNFTEHFIYIATFGPAMILPYFLGGAQHWAVILAYLVLFDVVNAYGHTNFTFCRHWVWESPWSPLRYLFYTPEFHLGHHHYYNCNYALFMPLWYVRCLCATAPTTFPLLLSTRMPPSDDVSSHRIAFFRSLHAGTTCSTRTASTGGQTWTSSRRPNKTSSSLATTAGSAT